jgi:hypothetical protein
MQPLVLQRVGVEILLETAQGRLVGGIYPGSSEPDVMAGFLPEEHGDDTSHDFQYSRLLSSSAETRNSKSSGRTKDGGYPSRPVEVSGVWSRQEGSARLSRVQS